jgi:hypothetical protein
MMSRYIVLIIYLEKTNRYIFRYGWSMYLLIDLSHVGVECIFVILQCPSPSSLIKKIIYHMKVGV